MMGMRAERERERENFEPGEKLQNICVRCKTMCAKPLLFSKRPHVEISQCFVLVREILDGGGSSVEWEVFWQEAFFGGCTKGKGRIILERYG